MKRNSFFLFSLIFLLMSTIGYAYEKKKKDVYGFTGEYPFDKRKLNVPSVVQKHRFQLNLKPEEVYDVLKKMKRKNQILDGTYGLNILQVPKIMPIKTITTVYLNPNFITTFIFPEKYKINSHPEVSFPLKVFSYNNNVLKIRPSRNLTEGNIVLTISDGYKNYVITIFCKRYIPNLKCMGKDKNGSCKNSAFYSVIKFAPFKNVFNPIEIIEEYKKLHHIKKLQIKHNLEYVTLSKNNTTYYIIRDDEFGDIFVDGLTYKIKTKL